MSLFRVYAFAVIAAAALYFGIQPGAAAPIPTAGPGEGVSRLLHLVHGHHSECIGSHRHRWDGLRVRCTWEDQDGDDDDGGNDEGDDDEGDDGGNCIQVGPLQYCQ